MDKLNQAFSYTKASQKKEKSKEKQREAKRSKEENRGQQLQSSLALLEHFPKSIFYMLYHFKAQEVKNPTLQTVYDLELK